MGCLTCLAVAAWRTTGLPDEGISHMARSVSQLDEWPNGSRCCDSTIGSIILPLILTGTMRSSKKNIAAEYFYRYAILVVNKGATRHVIFGIFKPHYMSSVRLLFCESAGCWSQTRFRTRGRVRSSTLVCLMPKFS